METEKKNFTRKNISEFFDAFKEHNMALMVDDTKVPAACSTHLTDSRVLPRVNTRILLFLSFFEKDLLGATDAGLPPPNVEVFCIHGSQVLALFVMLLMMTLV